MNRLVAILIVVFGVVFGAFAVAQSKSTGNGSLSLIKDLQSGLFTLILNDAEGVASFALEFKTGKLPYSGDFSGCQKSKTISNIAALNDNDLADTIKGRITDCRGGETEFEISAVNAKGKAQVKKLGIEPEPVQPPAPSPTPTPTPTTPTKTAPSEPTPAPATVAHEIIYPVAELGNCKNELECRAYCDLAENVKQCLDFAKKYQLLPEEEIKLAEKVLGVKGGPGGCNSRTSCENYCNDVTNIETCIAFAEENGLMKGKELEEAKKVHAVIQSGGKLPGNCRNKTACENYCKNSEHIDECLAFAESAGFLSPEELEQAKKFMPLIKSGETPGACKSKEECEAYCESDEHMDECIDFAIKHGMIPEEEREHIEAFKKAGGKGPGGCKGRQCQAFCENPANQKACFEWAKENGILKEDDLRQMEEGKNQIKKVLGDAPPEVKSCIDEAIPGGVSALESGEFFGGEAVGEKIRSCFESFMSQMGGSFGGPGGEHGMPGGMPSGGDFSGPGGCKGPDECMAYCKDHSDECQSFGPPEGASGEGEFPSGPEGGGFPSGGFPGAGIESFGGLGDCKSPEECQAYCEANPEKCQGFAPPGAIQPHGSTESTGTSEQQFQQQYQQQHEQQYQQEYQKQYEQQYQQQYQQQSGGFQQTPPPPPPPTSSIQGPFGLLIAPFVELFR